MKHGHIEKPTDGPPDPPNLVIADAARSLEDLLHGPYSGLATAEAAALAAGSMRYLNYAAMHGGVTEPEAVTAVVAQLCTAVYRFPQLLGLLGDWVTAETRAGRLACDGGGPAWQLAESASAVLGEACEHADGLARCLGVAHSLTCPNTKLGGGRVDRGYQVNLPRSSVHSNQIVISTEPWVTPAAYTRPLREWAPRFDTSGFQPASPETVITATPPPFET
jgi:hypothetical protein